MTVAGVMMLVLLWLGLYPQPVFDMAKQPLEVIRLAGAAGSEEGISGGRE
jgi:NADH:ubiquinone oxidoreductase subunit 4 (subunit M)